MNAFLQIGVSLAVIWVSLLVITIFRKAFSTNRVLLLLTVLLMGAFCFYKGIKGVPNESAEMVEQENADRYFAVMYAQSGDVESAIHLFDKYVGVSENKDDLLILARLSALNNNVSKAVLYYKEYLEVENNQEAEEELSYLKYTYGRYTAGNNGAILDYLEQTGLTFEEAGFTEETDEISDSVFVTENEFRAAVLERLQKAAESELKVIGTSELEECGEYIVYVNNLLFSNTNIDMEDEQLVRVAKELNKIVNGSSELSRNDTVRNTALVANALTGDAKAVAKAICDYSTVYELSVATDLYVSGLVDESDFKKIPEAPERSVVFEVSERCKNILEDENEQLSDEQKEELERAVELIESSHNDFVLKRILFMLIQRADIESYDEKSKLYLEAAKGYEYADMDRRVSECIDNALENSAISNDYEYAAAMTGIISILSNDSTEGVRALSGYSKIALDRLMPVPMDNFEKKASIEEMKRNADEKSQVVYVSSASQSGGDNSDFDFTSAFVEKVTQKKATINIGEIDKSAFPMITTKLSFGAEAGITEDNIKNKINIYDCGIRISDYEVRKVKNQVGKIILLCDMSGSMDGSDGELRNAVINFAEGKTNNEQVAVVGFNSSIVFQSDFLSDKEEIINYAGKINANGGTSIFSSIISVANKFTDDVNDNNVIIVMTDGQDGNKPSDSTLVEELNKLVADHNCMIYTVGLGNGVDSTYLQQIASVGNGQYLYVDSAESLSSFYEFMHSQLSNSYIVTYEALDTIKNDRSIEVEYRDSVGTALKNYRLTEDGTNTVEEYENENFDIRDADKLQVYGFRTSYMYISKVDVKATLYGCNFKENEKYEIKLSGSLRNYTLNYEYVNDKELSVIIPSTIAPGDYSVKISSAAESASASNALKVVAPLEQQQFKFGNYIFTADSAKTDNNEIVLSGNVTMNGWLHFKGNVTFTGDCNDEVSDYCTMYEQNGAYIKYSVNGSSGLTHLLAKNGIAVPLPALGTRRLYSDPYKTSEYKSFPVDKSVLNGHIKVNGLAHIGGTVALYPDMIYSEAFYTELELKFLKNLLKNLPNNIFQNNATGAFAMTNTCFLLNASYEINYLKDNDKYKDFQFGAIDFYINKFGFELDTVTENYSVNGEVGFKAFDLGKVKGVQGFGLALAWTGGEFDLLDFESFELSANVEQELCKTPVPLTVSKMSIGASNLSGVKDLASLFKVTVTGGFNLEAADIIAKVPSKVKEFFDMDSLPLAELDEAKINVTLGDFNINFNSAIKLLGFKVGEGTIELGKMDYSNRVLNIYETEYGADVKLEVGAKPSWKNLSAELAGEGRVTLGYPFGGLTLSGDIGYNITWFLFDWAKSVHGDFGIGVYFNSNNEVQFIIKAYGKDDKGKTKGFRIDVSSSMGTQKTKY